MALNITLDPNGLTKLMRLLVDKTVNTETVFLYFHIDIAQKMLTISNIKEKGTRTSVYFSYYWKILEATPSDAKNLTLLVGGLPNLLKKINSDSAISFRILDENNAELENIPELNQQLSLFEPKPLNPDFHLISKERTLKIKRVSNNTHTTEVVTIPQSTNFQCHASALVNLLKVVQRLNQESSSNNTKSGVMISIQPQCEGIGKLTVNGKRGSWFCSLSKNISYSVLTDKELGLNFENLNKIIKVLEKTSGNVSVLMEQDKFVLFQEHWVSEFEAKHQKWRLDVELSPAFSISQDLFTNVPISELIDPLNDINIADTTKKARVWFKTHEDGNRLHLYLDQDNNYGELVYEVTRAPVSEHPTSISLWALLTALNCFRSQALWYYNYNYNALILRDVTDDTQIILYADTSH